MEAYRGLAILTTNLQQRARPGVPAPAPLRRRSSRSPTRPQRAAIWRRVFPAATPTDGARLRAPRAARASPGGNIRNIALNAAFLAADAGEPVAMRHLRDAARGEYAKLERPLTDAESRGWT